MGPEGSLDAKSLLKLRVKAWFYEDAIRLAVCETVRKMLPLSKG